MLRTKSILLPTEETDGVRISVMSRHTLNDGVTPHPRITETSYDEWLKVLATPARLVGDYYKRGLPWESFEQRYCTYLATPDIACTVRALARRSLDETITLLCIEDTPEHCHRRLLAQECKKYESSLLLSIF